VTGEVDAETSNGRISYSGDMIAGGDNRLITSNGDVDVQLLGTPGIKLDASTSNGDVTSELPITATTTSDDHLVGTIGDGEADLYIRTSNGDITIK
jgi:lia operon protein LiaG